MMLYIWLGIFVAFLVIEAATVGLTAIWFSVGALAGLVCAALDAQLYVQILAFVIISAVVLILLKPLVKKYFKPGRITATNADRMLGQVCKVVEDIDNIASVGKVTVDGKLWSARSETGANIESGAMVRVLRIEGVKLIVTEGEESTGESDFAKY